MQKTHIRTYRITDAGVIEVTAWKDTEKVDLSPQYEGVAVDRHETPFPTSLDIFRRSDDRLVWAPSPPSFDVDAAITMELLLGVFLDDLNRNGDDGRAF
jgi:hypothetical protein